MGEGESEVDRDWRTAREFASLGENTNLYLRRSVGVPDETLGNPEEAFLKEKLGQGFTEVAVGRGGPYIDCRRLLACFAFYQPDGRISTFERWKQEHHGRTMWLSQPILGDYTPEEFEALIGKYHVRMTEPRLLADVVQEWFGEVAA